MLVLKQMLPHSNQISFFNFLYFSNELYINLMQFHFKQFILFFGYLIFNNSILFHTIMSLFLLFLFQQNKIKYLYTK
jgi:hypothetical protein